MIILLLCFHCLFLWLCDSEPDTSKRLPADTNQICQDDWHYWALWVPEEVKVCWCVSRYRVKVRDEHFVEGGLSVHIFSGKNEGNTRVDCVAGVQFWFTCVFSYFLVAFLLFISSVNILFLRLFVFVAYVSRLLFNTKKGVRVYWVKESGRSFII